MAPERFERHIDGNEQDHRHLPNVDRIELLKQKVPQHDKQNSYTLPELDVFQAEQFAPTLRPTPEHDFFSEHPRTDYAIWAEDVAKLHGIDPKDKGNEPKINALRHTLTSAVFTLKYGAQASETAGH